METVAGLPITSFRLASSQRRFDRSQERWVDGETNWYTITGFRQLAINAAASVKKGDRVVVVGRLKIRDWENGERSGTTIEIDADSLGHDLMWGSSAFIRSVSTTAIAHDDEPGAEAASPDEFAPAEPASGGVEPILDAVEPASSPQQADAVPVPF